MRQNFSADSLHWIITECVPNGAQIFKQSGSNHVSLRKINGQKNWAHTAPSVQKRIIQSLE